MRAPVALLAALALAACSKGAIDLVPGSGGGGAGGAGGGGTGGAAQGGGGHGGLGGAGAMTSSGVGGHGGAGGACPDPSCPCGLTTCLGTCVDTENDPAFCGACDNPCRHNQVCRAGQCECLPGFELCSDGSCHHTASDPDHCGSCPHACGAGEACDHGTCSHTCSGGLTACPASDGRSACVDLASNEPYCGTCGNVCGPTQVCAGAHCADFRPATPCSTCPCDTRCAELIPAPAACCPGVAGGAQPICVHASTCP